MVVIKKSLSEERGAHAHTFAGNASVWGTGPSSPHYGAVTVTIVGGKLLGVPLQV